MIIIRVLGDSSSVDGGCGCDHGLFCRLSRIQGHESLGDLARLRRDSMMNIDSS